MEVEATSPPTLPIAPPDAGLPDVDRVEAELAGVEHALARLEDGTYGTCEVCGSGLDDALLEAAPTSRRCPTHP